MRRLIAALMVLVAAAVGAREARACWGTHGVARERANLRACFANQKTIGGAIEMYCLDNNLPGDLKVAKRLTRQALQPLVDGGYLQSIPQDPGQGAEALENYVQVPFGIGIACLVHGTLEDCGKTPARAQLAAHGVCDPELLTAAADTLPTYPAPGFPWPLLLLQAVLAAIHEALARMCRWLLGDPKNPGGHGLLAWIGRAPLLLGVALATIPSWRAGMELPMLLQGLMLCWLMLPVSALALLWAILRALISPFADTFKWSSIHAPVLPRIRLYPPVRPVAPPVAGVKLLALVRGTNAHCPVCGDDVKDVPVICCQCRTPHHDDCFRYNGQCGMYACGGARADRGVN